MSVDVHVANATVDFGFPIVNHRCVLCLSFTEQDYIDDPDLENKINQLIEELSNENPS